MKPIQVYVSEDEHKELKQIALDRGITLSGLLRLYMKVKDEHITESDVEDGQEIEKPVRIAFCKHEAVKGFCKKGCK